MYFSDMGIKELCETYLKALNTGDLVQITTLFEANGIVVSPLYGTLPIKDFFTGLFNDTSQSVTTFKDLYLSERNRPFVALEFHYQWTLKSGKTVEFSCVDVFELNPARNKFIKLTIIYDTAPLRADFQEVRVYNTWNQVSYFFKYLAFVSTLFAILTS